MIEPARNGPLDRFLRACERTLRIWVWLLGVAILLALFGLVPSLIGVAALLGVVWIPILLLIFWGRLLDETLHMRSDMEDGPR
ncbi:MAG: hypothetical protein AAF713_18570 [Pseudomonadota bacterium]